MDLLKKDNEKFKMKILLVNKFYYIKGGCETYYFSLKKLLEEKKLKRVLVVATGALLNPIILQQKETIPCIAHAVALCAAD